MRTFKGIRVEMDLADQWSGHKLNGRQSLATEAEPDFFLPSEFYLIAVNDTLQGLQYSSLPPGEWSPYCLKHHHLLWVITSTPEQGEVRIENHFNDYYYPPDTYGEGDSILIPAGVTHQVTLPSNLGATLWLFDQGLFNQIVNHQPKPDGLRQLIPRCQIRDSSFYHLTMALQANFSRRQTDEDSPQTYLDLLVAALVDRLIRRHSVCQLRLTAHLKGADLALLLAYIDSHLEQDLNSQHLAGLINLEATELEQDFEQVMGLPLGSYLQGQRQQRLQQLLKTLSPGQLLIFPPNLLAAIHTTAIHLHPRKQTDSPQHYPVQAAIAWLNQRLLATTGKPLTDTQVRVLIGVLHGQRYSQMAQQYNQSEGHLKGVAADLWKQLSLICGEPIRKPNLWAYLQRQGLLPPGEA